MTLDDLDRIETLTLEDFAVDFSNMKIPSTSTGERLSDPEMDDVVDSFLASLTGEGRTR